MHENMGAEADDNEGLRLFEIWRMVWRRRVAIKESREDIIL